MAAPSLTIPASGALRIALLIETDGPGGAEGMYLALAEELRRRGHAVLAVGPAERAEGWLSARLAERAIPRATYTLQGAVDPGCVRRLAACLAAHRTEVVHSHEFTMAVYGAAAARRIGARHVITMHGGRYYAEAWRRRAALRWAARRSHAVVGVSRATAAELARTLRLPASRVAVVPNGIAFRAGDRARARRELGIADAERLILAVGNLYPVKGHDVLIEALATLPRERARTWRLAIAGRGGEEARLAALAAGRGIADRVHLLGFRDDVPHLLAAPDVFAMPSRSEGLPLALVEAMAAGCAVVASRVGGIPEVVADGTEGILAPPGDAAALGGALGALLDDDARRAALGEAARRRARRDYAASAMADSYERLYGPPGGTAPARMDRGDAKAS